MPRTRPLTPAQQDRKAMGERAQWLANGLAAYKSRKHMSLKEMSGSLQVSDKTMSRILDGDYKVRIPVSTLWKMEAIARKILIEETEVGIEEAETYQRRN